MAWTVYRHPLAQFIRETATMRMLIVGAGFLTFVSIVLAAVNVQGGMFSCSSTEKMLMYPYYDSRGNIAYYTYMCGVPHRGCNKRDALTFECSPFMAPEGTLTRR